MINISGENKAGGMGGRTCTGIMHNAYLLIYSAELFALIYEVVKCLWKSLLNKTSLRQMKCL